jgi:hypothetical protein
VLQALGLWDEGIKEELRQVQASKGNACAAIDLGRGAGWMQFVLDDDLQICDSDARSFWLIWQPKVCNRDVLSAGRVA